jgi:hypothetical protein
MAVATSTGDFQGMVAQNQTRVPVVAAEQPRSASLVAYRAAWATSLRLVSDLTKGDVRPAQKVGLLATAVASVLAVAVAAVGSHLVVLSLRLPIAQRLAQERLSVKVSAANCAAAVPMLLGARSQQTGNRQTENPHQIVMKYQLPEWINDEQTDWAENDADCRCTHVRLKLR